mmetsp:Transcript_33276/g.76793  ORF Transcript_33276/g.76793 Transcript_33276/m.76793 type:complete len:944 (-) Transcript_33276:95-2926(-)
MKATKLYLFLYQVSLVASFDEQNVYSLISSGNCHDRGLEPVYNRNECTFALTKLPYGEVDDGMNDIKDVIDGCTIFNNKGKIVMSINPIGTCEEEKYPDFCSTCDDIFQCVCREKAKDQNFLRTETNPTQSPTAKALYALVTTGTCEESGYKAIYERDVCIEGTKYLDFDNMNIEEKVYSDFIEGCTIVKGRAFGFVNKRDSCNVSDFPQYCSNCDENYPCVCATEIERSSSAYDMNAAEPYIEIKEGICQNYGYFPIYNMGECERAANFVDAGSLDMQLVQFRDFPDGCTIVVSDGSAFVNPEKTCDVVEFPRYCSQCSELYPCLCSKSNTSSPTSAPTIRAPYIPVNTGTCESNGYFTILALEDCKNAVQYVGKSTRSAQTVNYADWVNGCSMYKYDGKMHAFLNKSCDYEKYLEYCTTCDDDNPCLCKGTSSEPTTSPTFFPTTSEPTTSPTFRPTVRPTPNPTKPAQFIKVTSGRCEDIGYHSIYDVRECEAATSYTGATSVSVEVRKYQDFVDGCSMLPHQNFAFVNPSGTCNSQQFPVYCRSCEWAYPCMCSLTDPEVLRTDVPSTQPSDESLYKVVKDGNCFEHGYYPIFDQKICGEAVSFLGFGDVSDVQEVAYDDWVDGCTTYTYKAKQAAFVNKSCLSDEFPDYCSQCEASFPCVCMSIRSYPTVSPTMAPTTSAPTLRPTAKPSSKPSNFPSTKPSLITENPTKTPQPTPSPPYLQITVGVCENYAGFTRIFDQDLCDKGIKELGMVEANFHEGHFDDFVNGCTTYMDNGKRYAFVNPPVCDTVKYPDFCASCSVMLPCICIKETYLMPSSTPTSAPTQSPEVSQKDLRPITAEPTFVIPEFLGITANTCEYYGLKTINRLDYCEAAARQNSLGFKTVQEEEVKNMIDGCMIFRLFGKQVVIFNENNTCDDSNGIEICRKCDLSFPCLCISK